MKVKKVGMLKGAEIDLGGSEASTFAAVLTNCESPNESTSLQLPIVIGQGVAARTITLEVSILTSILESQLATPVNFDPNGGFRVVKNKYVAAFIFKNQLFLASNEFVNDNSEEEAQLLIKRQILAEEKKLNRLKMEVEALERADQSGHKRTAIPEIVKLVVWERDEGKCVRCGSSQSLHFDHIIPVAKGGSSSEANIQLLCASCNLEKSDRIAF